MLSTLMTFLLAEAGMPSGVDVAVNLLGSLDYKDCINRPLDCWLFTNGWRILGCGRQLNQQQRQWNGGIIWDRDRSHNIWRLRIHRNDHQFYRRYIFAFDAAWKSGESDRLEYEVTDFSMHSSLKRMWIWVFRLGTLKGNLHVAHGEASSSSWSTGYADTFSSISGSHQSNLGVMRGRNIITVPMITLCE